MRVPHAPPVNDVRHLHARVQFIGLHLHGEDGNLRALHIGQHRRRHIDQRTRSQVFQQKRVPLATPQSQLRAQRGGNRFGSAVGDQRDLFRRINAQASGHSRQRARLEFSGIGHRKQISGSLSHALG